MPENLRFKLLHVGVAVPALEPAAEVLHELFGYRMISGPFDDPIQKVSVNFLTQSDDDAVEIELVAPLNENAPVQRLLAKGGGGGYHLCFETNDLERALAFLVSKDCIVVSQPAPAVAFGGRRIAWVYAQTRQLFELVEATLNVKDQ